MSLFLKGNQSRLIGLIAFFLWNFSDLIGQKSVEKFQVLSIFKTDINFNQ
jgi:hypothetical protein